MHESIIQQLLDRHQEHPWTRKSLLIELFVNAELKNTYPNDIRRATIIGKIANEVLDRIGETQACKILAIGDIEYFEDIKTQWQEIIQTSLSEISASELGGYDLGGLGTMELRRAIVRYMSGYYNLSSLPNELEDAIIPSYGGTDSFVTILNTLRILSRDQQVRFIYPEASFLASVKIAETFLGSEHLVSIPKASKNQFFMTYEQIEELYKNHLSTNETNIFYITPVGNPTGNTIEESHIVSAMMRIHELDPNAIFIVDTVYVGLLPDGISQKLLSAVFANASLMSRVICTESLSKTLGTTGIRIGWTWTLNPLFSSELKKYTSLTKAGFSKILDTFAQNLLENPKVSEFQNRVYAFWSKQRMGFLAHAKEHFAEFFDFEASPNISDREGIYVLLKIRDGFSKEAIFAETGIIGVGIRLSDGEYIRYAFGNVNGF